MDKTKEAIRCKSYSAQGVRGRRLRTVTDCGVECNTKQVAGPTP